MNKEQLQNDLIELKKFRAQLQNSYSYFNGMDLFRSETLNKTLLAEIANCDRKMENIQKALT